MQAEDYIVSIKTVSKGSKKTSQDEDREGWKASTKSSIKAVRI